MKAAKIIVLLSLLATTLAVAGTLDDAPFKVVLPGDGWKLDDSIARDMGKDVSWVATISSTNTLTKSVVIKAVLAKATATSLDELSEGIEDSFSNPKVKKLADEPTVFLGFKARRFAFEVNGTSYNEAIVFVAGNHGWTVSCTGSSSQTNEVHELFAVYQKK